MKYITVIGFYTFMKIGELVSSIVNYHRCRDKSTMQEVLGVKCTKRSLEKDFIEEEKKVKAIALFVLLCFILMSMILNLFPCCRQ